MFLKISSQLKTELKHNLKHTLFASLIILSITYFIFGLKNLDEVTQAMIVERFLPLMGIFTISILFYPEQKSTIKDILVMKNTSLVSIYLFRFFIRLLIYVLISAIYIMQLDKNVDFKVTLMILLHSISIGLVIGTSGLLTFSFTKNIFLALLVSIGLILIQWFAPKNKANFLLLLTMPRFSISRIAIIFVISLLFLVIAIIVWRGKRIV